jgi:hypothetical protein
MATNAERSSHLLNLLKFSAQNSAAQQQLQQQHQPQPQPQQQQQQVHPQTWQMFQHQSPQGQPQVQPHLHHLQHQPSSGHFQAGGHHGYQPSSLSQSFQPAEQTQGVGNADNDDTDTEVEVLDVPAPRIHQPAPVPADPTGLLAALMRGTRDVDTPKLRSEPDMAATVPTSSFSSSFSTASPGPNPDTRTYLLNLLNRPKPSQSQSQSDGQGQRGISGQDEQSIPQQASMPSSYTAQAAVHNHHAQQADPNYYDFQRALQDSAQSGYSYGSGSQKSSYAVNGPEPSDYTSVGQATSVRAASNEPNAALHLLQKPSPLAREVQPSAPSPISKDSPILGHAEGHSTTVGNSPAPSSHLTPQVADKEKVSDAVQAIAETVDREADEALARAEQDVAIRNIANDLENMLTAQTEQELEETTHAAAQVIQQELDRKENDGLLEATLQPAVAGPVRELVDEAAYGPVADSWESADHEGEEVEAIKDDSPAPVRVFEFPMRPWISIRLTPDGTEPRPQFSDKSIMAVAKLKKEFDQVDRNLYTASQRFMAYGMSRAGGMRVIHQEDGLDTKVFTDTNDRIFNVSMPVTPSDHQGRHREAVIGTGLSGTVYWVQLVDGDRNYWQDAHLEQHGFALPPIVALDGETVLSNGVLKTRARISNAHPEFFAVARGKWINIVWPSLILHKNILKPGHDRVVDTDLLTSKCSLRINTSKSGKDFAFSQDDSVIVSLDKSGRVKFWDVRDLTASAAEDPMQPAHSSMELTEPIRTLSTTPEGERAWPTSVLLLDKLKPYQKRSALRYMIVGLNQNHTFQLWDLALGKPVQELNLPHSKENDAMCSVMYHATTGMIVIGHPTRNSVYFAHLSAPKYNLRPLSQAEYMHKLVMEDPSLPNPDSTAVISGVREYSFSNLGDLRSLDILSNPAVQQHGTDELPLFELYAMHSKGVACLIIKSSDLGWARDNSVLAPVNALEAGAILVDKLDSLPAEQPQAPAPAPKEAPMPFRIATRTTPRDSLVPSPGDLASTLARRGPDLSARSRDRDSDHVSPDRSTAADKKPQRKRKPTAPDALSSRGIDSARATPTIAEIKHADLAARPASGAPTAASPQAIQQAIEPLLASVEARIGGQLNDVLNTSLRSLQVKIEEGNHSRDSDFKVHQARLLDVVSDTLNNNTQKVLQAIIRQEFLHSVVPAISNAAGKAVNDQIGPQLAKVSSSIRDEIQSTVPEAVHRALQALDLSQRISERVGRSVSSKLTDDIVPHLSQVFTDVTVSACQHVLEQSQQQTHEQMELLLAARRADSQKIEQLSSAVARLTDTVMAMAGSQAQFQDRFLRMQQPQPQHQHQHQQSDRAVVGNSLVLHSADRFERQRSQQSEYEYQSPTVHGHGHGHSVPHLHGGQQQSPQMGQQISSQAGTHQAGPPHQLAAQMSQEGVTSPASQTSTQAALSRANAYIARQAHSHGVGRSDRPAEQVKTYFEGRQFEKALLAWIQSGNEDHMFDTLIYSYNPEFMRDIDLPPLVLMSIATTVSQSLKGPHVAERVAWMDTTLQSLQRVLSRGTNDEQAVRVLPKVMGLVTDRMEKLFGEVSRRSPMDSALQTLSRMLATAATIVDVNSRALPNGNRATYMG